MNRYLVTGVVADAMAGRRVLVFLPSLLIARYAYRDAMAHLKAMPVPHVMSRRERQVVFPSGGEILFLSTTTRGAGPAADIAPDVLVGVECTPPSWALQLAMTSSRAPRHERVVA